MARVRKVKGAFCERREAAKQKFDKRSFRYKRSGRAFLLIGCPTGKWNAKGYYTGPRTGKRKKGVCKAGTRVYKVLAPTRTGRCPVGEKRINK